jgi:flagellar biosynthesis protein FlhG
MKPLEELDHYEVLEVSRDARAEEIERAYALVIAAYGEGSLASYSVFDDGDTHALRERIAAAYRVLSDPDSRQAYDASLGGGAGGSAEAGDGEPLAFESVAEAPEVEPGEAPVLEGFDEVGESEAEGDWDGARLRRSRMLRGLDLEAIAAVTKVNPAYLRFVEEERFDALPAAVYVRGFVTAYARHLGLDAPKVATSYIERFEEHHQSGRRSRLLGRR